MKAQDYWKQRVLLAKQKEMESTAEYEAAMRSRLKDLENEFIKESKKWLSKYANENNQSLKQAADYLSSIDTSKFDMTLAEFEAKAKAGGYEKELNSAYYKSRIARLQELYMQYQNLAASYANSEEANMALSLAKRYQDTYLLENYNKYLVVGGIDVNLAHFNEQELKDIVYQPWKGSDFSKRIWNNYTKVMPEVLTDVMFRSIALGYSHAHVEQILRDRFQGVVNSNIHRLVVTEMGHAAEQATAKFYEDSKIEQYEYLATLESHTCEQCAHLDGRIFSIKNKVEGLNYPLIHPYCRCTTMPYIKGLPDISSRWSRDPITGKGKWLDGNMTYKDWAKAQGIHVLTAKEWTQAQNIPKLDVAKFLKLSYNVTGYLNKPAKAKDVPKTLQHIDDISISDYIDKHWKERPISKPEDAATQKAVKANLIEQANRIAKLSVLPTVEIRMRVHTSDLESILDSGFKTQLETKSSGGAYNPSLRKEATAKLFNLSPKEINDLKPSEFEKYGYLWDTRDKEPESNILDQYGNTKIIFKKEIRDRTTYFHGDSLGIKGSLSQELNRPAKLGAPNPSYLRSMWKFKANDGSRMKQKLWRDPSRKLSDDYTNINQFLQDPSRFYNEAQIHGPLAKNDIKLMIIPKDELTKSLKQKLEQKGIKYKVIGGK